jgi:hypothetical protein
MQPTFIEICIVFTFISIISFIIMLDNRIKYIERKYLELEQTNIHQNLMIDGLTIRLHKLLDIIS